MTKTYKLSAAVKMVANYGHTSLSINQDVIAANPVVTIHQDFTKNGKAFATFKRARGKYAGNTCGSAY